MAKISYLECSRCENRVAADAPQSACPKCAGPLYVRYDLNPLLGLKKESVIVGDDASMWRYRALLPDMTPLTLGEGFTPLLPSRTNEGIYIKDEGRNPIGTIKSRGISLAVTMARHYRLQKLALASEGNSAGALAAYAAAARIEAHVIMPRDVPVASLVECRMYGAHLKLVDGFGDCERMMAEREGSENWFDLSSLKEPFRVEGEKTVAYEIVEQLGWRVPDAIISHVGDAGGLIGTWKAFEEMEQIGWIGRQRPRMIAVQTDGVAPYAAVFEQGKSASETHRNSQTLRSNSRVPNAHGDIIVTDILRRSNGSVIRVSDDETMSALREYAQTEGVLVSPEGAATLAAYKKKLHAKGFFRAGETVVLLNTNSAYKYIDFIAEYLGISAFRGLPESRSLGGIIQPV